MMKAILRPVMTMAMAGLLVLPMLGQIRTPAPSPSASFEQALGLSTVSMEYSRPGKKGRDLFGGLVPYDQIWRTGANASTKITFSDDMKLAGKEVEAGTYALYSIPGENEWTLMLYSDLTLGGNVAGYDESNEYLRFTVKPQEFPMEVETMTFMVQNVTSNSAVLVLVWGNTMVPMQIEAEVDEAVMAQINRVMNGPSANDYYAAATYYYNTDRDMEQALEWINQALEENADRYWVVTWKARILGKMENYEEAVATAEQAKSMAQKAGNPDYVKINSDLIAEFQDK